MAPPVTTSIGFWDSQTSPWVLPSLAVGLAFLCWHFLSSSLLDSREPPEVKSSVPVVGHLFGLLWHQAEYLKILSCKVQTPAFTIRVFGTRIYVICSPKLIQKVFSNPKVFSFEPFVSEASRRLLNMDESAMKIFSEEPGVGGGPSYANEIHDHVYASLAPGPALSQMNARFQSYIASHFNDIGIEGRPTGLYKWMRDVLTGGVCSALYGINNPFENDLSLIDSLWDLERGFNVLLLNFVPRLTARKAFLGRTRLYSAFHEYFGAGLWQDGADIVRDRVGIARKHGYSEIQIAEYETPIIYASVTNAVSFAFWLLSYVLADEDLKNSVRNEVGSLVTMEVANGVKTAQFDLSAIRSKCPLLVSVWDEMLRFNTFPTAVRSVTTDTLLNNKYLLKTGGIIQMPSSTTHTSTSIWGPNATIMNPQRFLKHEKRSTQQDRDQLRLQNKSYFPFGGGKHLCPGRYFAFNEVLSFVSMILYTCTIERQDGTPFKIIPAAKRQLGAAISKPEGDAEMVIRRRAELEGWKLAFSTS